MNGSLKAYLQRARKATPSSLLRLLNFVTSQTNRDALAGFSTIPEFLVIVIAFEVRDSRRHGSEEFAWQAQILTYAFVCSTKGVVILMPSTEALEYLEYLVRNKTVSDTTRSRSTEKLDPHSYRLQQCF